MKPTCAKCNDTHQVFSAGLERSVPCTYCPTPCDSVAYRTNATSAYCDRAPCPCVCHKSAPLPLKPVEVPTLETPCCERRMDETGWRGLDWLQHQAGVEIRRCICGQPVGRVVTLAMVRPVRGPESGGLP